MVVRECVCWRSHSVSFIMQPPRSRNHLDIYHVKCRWDLQPEDGACMTYHWQVVITCVCGGGGGVDKRERTAAHSRGVITKPGAWTTYPEAAARLPEAPPPVTADEIQSPAKASQQNCMDEGASSSFYQRAQSKYGNIRMVKRHKCEHSCEKWGEINDHSRNRKQARVILVGRARLHQKEHSWNGFSFLFLFYLRFFSRNFGLFFFFFNDMKLLWADGKQHKHNPPKSKKKKKKNLRSLLISLILNSQTSGNQLVNR